MTALNRTRQISSSTDEMLCCLCGCDSRRGSLRGEYTTQKFGLGRRCISSPVIRRGNGKKDNPGCDEPDRSCGLGAQQCCAPTTSRRLSDRAKQHEKNDYGEPSDRRVIQGYFVEIATAQDKRALPISRVRGARCDVGGVKSEPAPSRKQGRCGTPMPASRRWRPVPWELWGGWGVGEVFWWRCSR